MNIPTRHEPTNGESSTAPDKRRRIFVEDQEVSPEITQEQSLQNTILTEVDEPESANEGNDGLIRRFLFENFEIVTQEIIPKASTSPIIRREKKIHLISGAVRPPIISIGGRQDTSYYRGGGRNISRNSHPFFMKPPPLDSAQKV